MKALLRVALLGRATGVELVHVAYKGGAPLLNDLIGGQIPAGIDVLSESVPHHHAGKLRILASSGAKRSPIVQASGFSADQ